jgi:hypothetical protein
LFYATQDKNSGTNEFYSERNNLKNYSITWLKNLYSGPQYVTEVNFGLYGGATFIHAVLSENNEVTETERYTVNDPTTTTTVRTEYERTWLSFNRDQLESGLSLQMVYRFNRKFSLRYGLNAGVTIPMRNAFQEVVNVETRETISTETNSSSTSQWALSSNIYDKYANVSWTSDGRIGVDFRPFEKRDIYFGLGWRAGVSMFKTIGYKQLLPFSGFQIHLVSSFR